MQSCDFTFGISSAASELQRFAGQRMPFPRIGLDAVTSTFGELDRRFLSRRGCHMLITRINCGVASSSRVSRSRQER
jgi:hypothetical protein